MGSHETNLELWVLKQLEIIHSNASGRARKELRDECERLKDGLRAGQLGTPGSSLSIPFPPTVADPLLAVLRGALATGAPKLAEPALACLHKLVAYAYLQGETRPSGRLDDASNAVTRAVMMAARAGASPAAPVQLSVVKTLLTLATAEHFVCHGDTLMQAVRAVFNVAVGGAGDDIRATARSALLQMLNTIVKRVAQQIITPGGTPMISPVRRFDPEVDGEDDEPPGAGGSSAAAVAAAIEAAGPPSSEREWEQGTPTILEEGDAGGPSGAAAAQSRLPRIRTTPVGSPDASSAAAAAQQQHLEDTRTAHLANLAEQADLQGLEAAMVAPPADQPPALGAASFSGAPGLTPAPPAALPAPPPPSEAPAPRSPLLRVDTPPDPRRALMRERRAAEWRRLTVPERDAAVVVSAMCKMAAREGAPGAAESALHAGKLLALDMLVKVLNNPAHDWSQVRREFAQQLRQPLCLALLRNCTSPTEAAVEAAVAIFGALLAAPRLREFMKAEIGALYPLLLLRPLEGERAESAAAAAAALRGLAAVTASPQVLVDVFVNYDCNLQAANLFERSMKALSRFCQIGDAGGPVPAAAVAPARATALRALLAAVKAMDTWAGPLKSVPLPEELSNGAAAAPAAAEPSSPGAAASHLHHDVLQRIQTDKAIKASLESGIAAFNANPVKGLAALVASGAVAPGAAAAAAFLREAQDRLDPAAVGELLGHHSEEAVAVMRAYVAGASYAGATVDVALRRLLAAFRLPGEAQKIDRLMEAFAARYCADNPGAFPSADAPYLLAFAIIMLNTDAHNPMAEARISADDFVSMCVYQSEAGEYEQILPGEDIAALYRRIVDSEIEVRPFGGDAGGDAAGGGRGGGKGETKGRGAEASRRSKLAAALGLGQLAAPFWSGASWDKQHGVGVERQRLLELTGQLLAGRGGGAAGPGAAGPGAATLGIWHAATHAEHARPMMQVCGPALGPALAAALARADTLVAAAAVLDGFEQAIRLAALLRLETLCEGLVARLAEAARLGAPAPPQTPEEARQVAALARLIALGTCSEAGALGSAWVVLLRALSELEALKAELTPGADASFGAAAAAAAAAAGGAGAVPRPTTSPAASPSAAAGARAGGGAAAAGAPSGPASLLGRLLTSSRSGAAAEAARPSTTVVSERSGRRGPLAVRSGPGLGAVLWAETAGAGAVDGVFDASAALDGDAVLTFFRALAAVSQEELDPGVPGAPPRAYLLHRLVEVAAANARRIRIVWQRLWPVVSQHLVSAACHADPYIAMFAVDAMRQLADRLLSGRGGAGGEGGGAGFGGQGDALRPLGAVLRCSDRPAVRELAVACVAHLLATHERGMGPAGWRAALAALAVAAADPAPAVVAQAMDVLSTVFAALYEAPGGHAALTECLGAALAVARNPTPAAADLAPSALYLVQGLARRLAEGPAAPTPEREGLEAVGEAWAAVLGVLAAVGRTDPRPKVADAAAAALFQVMAAHVGDVPAGLWGPLFAGSAGPLLALSGAAAAAAAAAAPPPPPAAAASPGYAGAVTRRATPPAGPLPAPSADQLSPEGAARVLRQAAAHLPELWALLASTDPAVAGALLGPCLRLLRSYAESPIEAAAGLGTRQLHALLAVAGPALPPEGWAEVEAVLGAMMEPPVGPPEPADGANAAAALRRRCRSSLIAMRCVGEMLAARPAPMPPAVQLRLLGALEAAVGAAAELNADPHRRAALARALDAEDAAASLLSERRLQPARGSADGGAEAVSSPAAPSPTAAGFAAAVRAEAGEWDRPVLPALLRHEVEGGRALAAALRAGAGAPGDAPAAAALRAECEARLAGLALRTVHAAAGRVAAGAPTGPEPAEEAVRAALVKDALLALAELPSGAWRDARAEVIGHASRLVCSQEVAVRRGVQALLRAQAAQSPALRGGAPAATAR